MYILMVIRTFPFHNTYLLLLLLLLFSSSAPKLIYMADAMSKKKTSIPVVLIGCGGVGQQLLHHILATRALHANSQEVHVSIKAVCDSRSFIIGGGDGSELDDAVIKRILLEKASKSPLSSLQSCGYNINVFEREGESWDLSNYLEQWSHSTGLVVVDCSASDDTALLLSRAAGWGLCIVLANKKPLTSSMDIYSELCKRRRRIRYESTVGAGLPVITALGRFLTAGDPVYQIVGALSGTLAYVMSNLQGGATFSSTVQLAKSHGYTEPDPRDDLSGMDVARKALILGRLLGWHIDMGDVEVESLFPEEMEQDRMSLEQFMLDGLPSLNEKIDNRVNLARSRGCVLCYVATIKERRCKVGIEEVPLESPLGLLKGSDNLVEIYSRCYSKSPFVLQGAGAGNDTTAAGVLADIMDFQDLF